MRKIKREISTFTINSAILSVENGKPAMKELPPFDVIDTGMYSEKALKLARNKYGKDLNLAILSIGVVTHTYEMDVETFMKHAIECIDAPEEKEE